MMPQPPGVSNMNRGKPSLPSRIASELGVYSILGSSRDTKLLCVSRFVRHLAYGASTLILAIYLSKLGVSETRIGLFMTLTLLGDVIISLLLTLVADSIGRRRILLLGSVLMTASGVVFMLSGNYWVLVAASIFGVISPSGNEIGPFRAIEESTLAQLSPPSIRSDIFAWLTLVGKAGDGFGTVIGGWLVEALLRSTKLGETWSYRLIFGIYASLGVIKFLLALMLSDACEPESPKPGYAQVATRDDTTAGGRAENEGLLSESEEEDVDDAHPRPDQDSNRNHTKASEPQVPGSARKSFWPSISSESRKTLLQLCLLFGVDSFASGLVPLSWISYFFNTQYRLSDGDLGTIFFVTNLLAAISNLFAASLSKRIGLIKTMVFTHLPSAIILSLIPLPSPSHAWIAITLLVIRSTMANMDQAPRQAFLSAVVLPAERTAVMGFVNVVKTLSQSGAPVVTGGLATGGHFWIAFVLAGSLKAGYDVVLLRMFLGYRSREEREERDEVRGKESQDVEMMQRQAPQET